MQLKQQQKRLTYNIKEKSIGCRSDRTQNESHVTWRTCFHSIPLMVFNQVLSQKKNKKYVSMLKQTMRTCSPCYAGLIFSEFHLKILETIFIKSRQLSQCKQKEWLLGLITICLEICVLYITTNSVLNFPLSFQLVYTLLFYSSIEF